MNHKNEMSISEFAYLSGINRTTLLFYDKIELLCPERRELNGYRRYSRPQLEKAYLIGTLRELGLSIEEIKKYADTRTPEKLIALFSKESLRVQKEIFKLRQLQELMNEYTEMAEDALTHKKGEINVITKPDQYIFRGPCLDQNKQTDDGLISFYNLAAKENRELGSPLGMLITNLNCKSSTFNHVSHYYFKTAQGHNSMKPAGKYAVIYDCCAFRQCENTLKALLSYIKSHNFTICGNAYEEYPLNELSVTDERNYCVKIEIMIR